MLKKHIKNQILLNIVEFAIVVVIAVIIYLLLNNFVIKTGRIDGPSMEPTLNHGDFVFISKTPYYAKKPQMGDIIAFPHPSIPDYELVKRVIGVEGDVVDYVNYVFYINGEELPAQYQREQGGGYNVEFPVTVPEGHVFVLGDNRLQSDDSRKAEIGCIDIKTVYGKVVFRLMPFSEIGIVK